MAGLLAHLIIAKEIINLLPENTIKNVGLFYAGSIAPDGIHAREGFVRADKRHTHLRDDIHDQDFSKPESLTLFHQRVAAFILKHRDNQVELLDLYRGYVAHLLTDELYLLTVRQEFVEVMEQQGIKQTDIEFYHQIMTDLTRNDEIIKKSYPGIDEICMELEKVPQYSMEGYLTEKELIDSRNWVINYVKTIKDDTPDPVYTSYERTLTFVKSAARDIIDRLSEGGSLPRMF